MLDPLFDADDLDLVLLAFGTLGDQADFDADPELAVAAAQTNYVGAVSAGLIVADRFRRQGHGTLVVLSSVAGERARRTNYVYGSTKAGLDAFAQGLGDALVDAGARVLVVRPGLRPHPHDRRAWRPSPSPPPPRWWPSRSCGGSSAAARSCGPRRSSTGVFVVLRHLPRRLWRIVSAR